MSTLQMDWIMGLLVQNTSASFWTRFTHDCHGKDVLWFDGCTKMEVAG